MLLGASAPLPANAPSLVVFTLVPSGTVTIESTARIAAAIGIRVETGGGIAVKSAPPDVKQADYLSVARQLGVDYYVTGFVGPLGGGFSAALQLVATSSGIPVWTGTTTLSGTDDVEDIADAVATVIRNRSIAYAAIPLRTPEPAATPAPPREALPAPVALAPGGTAAAPAATAPPGPPIDPNAPSVAVLDAIGAANGTSDEELTYASDAIALSLEKRGIVATRWHTQAPQIAVGGAALCEDTKTKSLVEPSVSTQTTSGMDNFGGNYSQVTVQLVTFDCTTHRVAQMASSANGAYNWRWAADKSIAAVTARVPVPKGTSK